jgi:tRNA (mo5U34)-methyltransferase
MPNPQAMTPEQVRAGVAAIEWFHTIDLGGGITTPGRDDSRRKLRDIRMPEDLRGKSVLDIGAYDGFFSFEAKRPGGQACARYRQLGWTGVQPERGVRVRERHR